MKLKSEGTIYNLLSTMTEKKSYLSFKHNLNYPGEALERYEEKGIASDIDELKSLALFAYEYTTPAQEHELLQRKDFLAKHINHDNIFIRLIANGVINTQKEAILLLHEGKEELTYCLTHLVVNIEPEIVESILKSIQLNVNNDHEFLSAIAEYKSNRPYFRLSRQLKTKEISSEDAIKAASLFNLSENEIFYLNYAMNPKLTSPAKIRIVKAIISGFVTAGLTIPQEVIRWTEQAASTYRKDYIPQNFWLKEIFYSEELPLSSSDNLEIVLARVCDDNRNYRSYIGWSFKIFHLYIGQNEELWNKLTDNLKQKYISNLSEVSTTLEEYSLLKNLASRINYNTNTYAFIKLEYDLIKDIHDYANISYEGNIDKYLSAKSNEFQMEWMQNFYNTKGLTGVGKDFFTRLKSSELLQKQLQDIYLELLFYYSPAEYPAKIAEIVKKSSEAGEVHADIAEVLCEHNLLRHSCGTFDYLKQLYKTPEVLEKERTKERLKRIQEFLTQDKPLYIYFEVKDTDYSIPEVRTLVQTTLLDKTKTIKDRHEVFEKLIRYTPEIESVEIGNLYKEVIINAVIS